MDIKKMDEVKKALETLSDIFLRESIEKNLGGIVQDMKQMGYEICIQVTIKKRT